MKAISVSAVFLVALISQGCDDATKKPSNPTTGNQVQAVSPTPVAPPKAVSPTPVAPPNTVTSTPATSAVESAPAKPAPVKDPNREKAEAGVGEKGRGYGGEGFITTPISAKFRLEQRIVFEIQIPEAMKLYKADHNKGPKNDAEFQRKIIEANSIKLPELPAGDSYIYDPATEELMVQHPKK